MVKKIFVLIFLLFGLTISLQAEEWLPIKEVDLRVQPQSALDFSPIFPNIEESLLIKNGHFFSEKSNVKQRMHCAVVSFTQLKGGFPTKQEAEQFADELFIRGYNLLRLHMLDMALMKGAKEDFDFNLKEMDKMFHLISELKKRGIYVEIDAETSWNGGYGDVSFPFEKNKHVMQLEIYLTDKARTHWKSLVQHMLLKKNPYTGFSLLHDPNVVLLTLMNEMGLNMQLTRLYVRQKFKDDLRIRLQKGVNQIWQGWLKEEYTDIKHLNQAWGYDVGKSFVDIFFKFKSKNKKESRDVAKFIYATEARVQNEMIQFLRTKGYKGFITNLNASREVLAGSVRDKMDVVTLHTYHDHPKRIGRLEKSAAPLRKQQNISSLGNQLHYMQAIFPSRLNDKPFVVDEYNHPFPNPWRREAGLAFPAYASFQDWDGLCRFAEPVQLSYAKKGQANTAISAFNVGMDPISRAGEALSALLFRRGDVPVAKRKAILQMNTEALLQLSGTKPWPEQISWLGLKTQLESEWQQDGRMQVVFSDENGVYKPAPLLKLLKDKENTLAQVFKEKKKTSEDIITEHIRFSADRKEFIVESKQTLAVTFSGEDARIDLKGMQVSSIQQAGLVSVSALDAAAVGQSQRLLITFQTDAQNSGMKLSNDGKTIKKYGQFPVRILRGKLSVSLKHTEPLALYALNLRGERIKALDIQFKQGELLFVLDNKVDGWGGVVFYELVKEKVSQIKGKKTSLCHAKN